jgi:hypothetical protein
MSITESLDHPWLLNHLPFHPPDFDEFQLTYADFNSHMNISHTGMSEPLGMDSFGSDGHHGGSPTSTLRRRKDVVAEAEKDGQVLPDPPSEMEANLTRANPPAAGRGNKRVRAELSVLPEDSLEQVYAEAAARSAAANANKPMDSGGDSLGSSGDRRRSGRRTKVPRRG